MTPSIGRLAVVALAACVGCDAAIAPTVQSPTVQSGTVQAPADQVAALVISRRKNPLSSRRARRRPLRFRTQALSGSRPGWEDREVERTTLRLRGGLFSPMPGGYVAGYPQDTGLDIGGFRLPVYAVATGTLDYSEPGHTRWAGDDDKAVRLELDEPIPWKGRRITHVWYAHLHELVYIQPEGAQRRIRVRGGERVGTSGIANGSPHLHLGLLLDGQVRQRWGTYLLDHEVREVLGHYRKKERLPVR